MSDSSPLLFDVPRQIPYVLIEFPLGNQHTTRKTFLFGVSKISSTSEVFLILKNAYLEIAFETTWTHHKLNALGFHAFRALTRGLIPYCWVSSLRRTLEHRQKDLSVDAPHAGSPASGGDTRDEPANSGCSSNDAESESLSCTSPSMTSMVKQEAHIHIHTAPWIFYGASNGDKGQHCRSGGGCLGESPPLRLDYLYWILPKCIHRMERILGSVRHE